MTFLADQRAVYESDLRVLLGRHSGHIATDAAVRQTVTRWRRAGLVKATKVFVGQPRIVSFAAGGAALVGERFRPDATLWGHDHHAQISRTRLWLEGGQTPYGAVQDWQPERRYRAEHFTRGAADAGHVPDAVVTFESGLVAAVEVELTPKDATRLTRIVGELTRDYTATIYVCPPRIARSVTAAYERVKADPATLRAGQLVVVDLPSELTA